MLLEKNEENPFKKMNFVKFWFVSFLFFLTFPISILLCYVFIGQKLTKQLIVALINDFLQTLFIIIILLSTIIYI
ncbi:PTS beta-glucoside transporter subunit IIABC, partial [Pseudomonadota bacterium]|nr:PTS beta-glucoside transporter subunit IIABC [Pseudomonadota bacterium]